MRTIGDVANHAEIMGIASYNTALSHFEKDRIIPAYETHVLELYERMGYSYEWSDITITIFESFIQKYGEITIILD